MGVVFGVVCVLDDEMGVVIDIVRVLVELVVLVVDFVIDGGWYDSIRNVIVINIIDLDGFILK